MADAEGRTECIAIVYSDTMGIVSTASQNILFEGGREAICVGIVWGR